MMNALSKLEDLKHAIERLERKSRDSSESASNSLVSLEDIEAIRRGISQLATEFEADIQGTQSIFQSYKKQRHSGFIKQTHSQYALTTIVGTEDEENKDDAIRDSSDVDDDTFKWLDENYGAVRRHTMISPTRSPLDRFKILGKMVKKEIKECHVKGIAVNDKNLSFENKKLLEPGVDMVDKALLEPRVAKMLKSCWNITEFDIFELNALEEIRGHILVVFGFYLSQQFTWFNRYLLPVDKFNNFLMAIEKSYKKIPYHNKIHAVDVTHTLMYLCKHAVFAKELSELDQLSCFLAAIIHDTGHTGQTNQYHINSQSEIATRYNDRSVLENYHLALAFQVLRDPANNFLRPLTPKEYRYVRDAVLLSHYLSSLYLLAKVSPKKNHVSCGTYRSMVLSTDMHHHPQQVQKLDQFSKILRHQGYFNLRQFTDKIPRVRDVLNEKCFIMEMALHLADISNPCKKTSVSVEWTKRITQEFFYQGDMEKAQELPVSAGCDRDLHKNMAKQSLGFIDFIVFPLWNVYHSIDPSSKVFIEQIQRNRAHWLTEARLFDEKEEANTETEKKE